MKSYLLLLPAFFFSSLVHAQTFNGTGGTIPGSSTTRTCFTINVTGVGVINTTTRGLAQVCMNITHPNDDELEIVLVAPDGTTVPLTVQNGGSGNNYTNTCFNNSAATSIKAGSAPFTGTYIPEGYLGAVNNGQNANGAWTLCIQDRRTAANAGSLVNWSITFNTTPAQLPPAIPPCSTTIPGTSSCATATSVCDFSGVCGNTSGTTVQDWAGSGLNACFGLENNSFVKFVASSTTASFSVWVPTTTTGGYNTAGIQMLFFSGTCNSGPVTTYGCYAHIYPYPSPGNPLVTIVNGTGFTPGNTYYLMIDGFNGDKCNYIIEANSGVNILNISPSAPNICAGGSVNLTATGGSGTYTWSPPGGLNTTTGPTVTASPAGTITYTVTSTTFGVCPVTKDVTVTVDPVPAAPVLTVVNNCGSSTITATGVTGTLTWSDGGIGNPRTVTTPGTYTVTQTVGGCTSLTSNSVTAAPIPVPSAPVLTVTDNCGNSTLTATGVTGTLTWSDGGTGNPRTVTIPGTYTVIQHAGGCNSANSNTVTAAPVAVPATPAATVPVQPTCTAPTGTIVITTPAGANLEYSINGINYQAAATFTNVAPGVYAVTVRHTITNCISNAGSATVNPIPAGPATPVASAQQPACNATTGTITVTSPTGANLEYSIDGTNYQASTTFTTVAPNTYSITVRNMITGCVSAASSVTVNAAPSVPAATATVVQPGCSVSTGSIVITSPTGTNMEYSLNGGTFQPGTSFSGLAPGTYSIVVRSTGSLCTSAASNFTLLPVNITLCHLDIYFPSAFTPNGDANNDEFGPGPLSNLAGITEYSLHVYNRYGELVFFTRNPYRKWDGRYKGKLTGNMTYVWQASYKRSNGVKEFQKGTVLIIK